MQFIIDDKTLIVRCAGSKEMAQMVETIEGKASIDDKLSILGHMKKIAKRKKDYKFIREELYNERTGICRL